MKSETEIRNHTSHESENALLIIYVQKVNGGMLYFNPNIPDKAGKRQVCVSSTLTHDSSTLTHDRSTPVHDRSTPVHGRSTLTHNRSTLILSRSTLTHGSSTLTHGRSTLTHERGNRRAFASVNR